MNDDYSPAPVAPGLELIPEDEQFEELFTRDNRIAKAYFHPQWQGVQDILEDKIEVLRVGCLDASLPAEEYKIEDLANKRVAIHLKDVLVQVQNAVNATEQQRKKGK